MRKNLRLIFFILLVYSGGIQAQTVNSKIRLIQDERLDLLEKNATKLKPEEQALREYSRPTANTRGYRIQIYSGSSRAEADDIRLRFMTAHSAVPCYIQFLSPYYKVRVGDYLSDQEANKELKTIKRAYPMSFVVSSYINP